MANIEFRPSFNRDTITYTIVGEYCLISDKPLFQYETKSKFPGSIRFDLS